MLIRLLWRFLRLFLHFQIIDGVEFVDFRVGDRTNRPDLVRLLGDAIHDIEWAGFGDLLTRNLRIIIATRFSERGAPALSGYFCNFEALEYDRIALSCRLLWHAKYYELTHGLPSNVLMVEQSTIERQCDEIELSFVRQFPDRENWVAFLEKHKRPNKSLTSRE